MLKKHRNELLNAIEETGLDPSAFVGRAEMIDSYEAFRITIGESPLYFYALTRFDTRLFKPGFSQYERAHPKPIFRTTTHEFVAWRDFNKLRSGFREWLDTNAATIAPNVLARADKVIK
jgi:hypothetical protein